MANNELSQNLLAFIQLKNPLVDTRGLNQN